MTGALLVGFEYANSKEPLPGTEDDLASAIEYAKRISCDPLIIVSDVASYIRHPSYVSYKISLEYILLRFRGCKRMVIYYSGHGTPRSWLLPDGRSIELETLARDVSALKIPEVVWILDSCCAWHLNLPYLLEKAYYRRIREALPSSRILCLLATQDLAWSTVSGSRFSRLFFSLLREGVRYLPTLVFRIGGIRVYSSRPGPLFLWEWMYGQTTRCSVEWNTNTIRVRSNDLPTTFDLLVHSINVFPP